MKANRHCTSRDFVFGRVTLARLSNISQRLRVAVCLVWFFCVTASANAVDPVKASLQTESAWTGQAVTMVITLYSPGPFSGTASMDLPEIPRTFFVRNGNPVVGSETVDGESLLTQRHEFHIYSQQTGSVVIPGFDIRFEGKKDFLSGAEPVSGKTKELSFESKRPPDQKSSGVVVAVSQLTVQQTWEPDKSTDVLAGDVIRRTLVQQAAGTSAMMLKEISGDAPDGVRLYTERPEVVDRNNRGDTNATRTDIIKYQFERAGTFELPPVEIAWFDIDTEEIQRESLPGITVSVTRSTAASSSNESRDQTDSSTNSYMTMLAVVLAVVLVAYKPGSSLVRALQAKFNQPEAVLARRIIAACRDNDADAAYAAVIQWQRLVAFSNQGSALQTEVAKLAENLFGKSHGTKLWSGVKLQQTFTTARAQQREISRLTDKPQNLPTLNPESPVRI